MTTPISLGPQPGIASQQFLSLVAPVHLPTLMSTDGAASIHFPDTHKVMAPEVSGFLDVLPLRQGFDCGTQEEFQLLQDPNNIYKSCALYILWAPLSAGAGGASPRYCDDLANYCIQKAEWLYGNTASCCTWDGDEYHYRQLQETEDFELDRMFVDQAAGLSIPERALRATALQETRIECPWWWTRSQAGGWHAYALMRNTKLRFTWAPAEHLLQQGVANTMPVPNGYTTYMVRKYLRLETVSPTEATKNVYLGMIEPMGRDGFLQLIIDTQRQRYNIPAGTTSFQCRLDMFTRYIYNVRMLLRSAADVAHNYQTGNNYQLPRRIDAIQFDVAGKTMKLRMDDFFMRKEINSKAYKGNPEIPIYNVPLTRFPDQHYEAMGGIDFANTSIPIVTLFFNAPLPVDCVVDFIGYIHNYNRTVIEGSNSAIETLQPI